MSDVLAQVVVPADAARAFQLFTRDVDLWWRRGDRYGGPDVRGHRFEPRMGGRFLEVLQDTEHVLGVITAWDPPHRLAFTWRQGNWLDHEVTHVDVRFITVSGGTRVELRHTGFSGVHSDVGCDVGYAAGWQELLGWFSETATAAEGRSGCTSTSR